MINESVDAFSWIGITMIGRTIINLRYADDIATLQEGLQTLINKLSTVSHEYKKQSIEAGRLKTRDWKTRHQLAGVKNEGINCMDSQ